MIIVERYQVRTVCPMKEPPMFVEPRVELALLEKGFLSPRAGENPDFCFIDNTSDPFVVSSNANENTWYTNAALYWTNSLR